MKRPWSVTLLTLGVLIFTGVFVIRLVQTLSLWDYLSTLPLAVSPLYLALTGLIWGLGGGVLSWGLWRGKPWAAWAGRIATLFFWVYFWSDRLFLAERSTANEDWPFWLGTTILSLLLIYWILARAGARAYFGELHD